MTTTQQLWDISTPVHSATPVYPGDTPYTQIWTSSIGSQSLVNVGTVTMTTHIGTHADAPLHYDANGPSIGAVDLTPYLGPCTVVHARGHHTCIGWQDIAHAVGTALPPRVLVRTYEQPPTHRDPNFRSLAPELISQLADAGVQLIGVDTPSIDAADSLQLESHMQVRTRGMRILENLVLHHVPEGNYELIALPLKLMQADASPVRAVLRTLL